MTNKVYEIINANIAMEKLINQQDKYNIATAYKIYKLKKNLDEIENFIMDRLVMILGENYDLNNLNENEKIIYQSLMMSDIDFDNCDLTMKEITNSDSITVTVNDIEKISKIVEK